MDFFNQHGTVLAVWRRNFPGGRNGNGNNIHKTEENNSINGVTSATDMSESNSSINKEQGVKADAENDNRTKPSVFVVFESVEQARNFVASPPEMNGTKLTAMMKNDYLQSKSMTYGAAKARQQQLHERETTRAGENERREMKSTTPPMPRNSSYRLTGCGEIAKFSDVKELWPNEEQKGVRYIFTPSKEEALIVFQDPCTATQMISSLEKRAPKLNEKEPVLTKLESAAEEELISSVEKEIADRAAQRAFSNTGGGRGGRGRGRGRGRGGKRDRY
uniref:Uncharacterized protein n=1 Tax=Lygus hesperus TaxID=30085 RepID=A0A0A9WU21_LYGHE